MWNICTSSHMGLVSETDETSYSSGSLLIILSACPSTTPVIFRIILTRQWSNSLVWHSWTQSTMILCKSFKRFLVRTISNQRSLGFSPWNAGVCTNTTRKRGRTTGQESLRYWIWDRSMLSIKCALYLETCKMSGALWMRWNNGSISQGRYWRWRLLKRNTILCR